MRVLLSVCAITGLSLGMMLQSWGATTQPATATAPALTGPLADFKTVDTCQKTTIQPNKRASIGEVSGFLGVEFSEVAGKLVAGTVEPDSPAAKAGLQPGDAIANFDGHIPGDVDDLRDMIQGHSPGDLVNISVKRRDIDFTFAATLSAVSRPMSTDPTNQVGLGVRVAEGPTETGARITQIDQNSPASRLGLRVGDVITQIDDAALGDAVRLADALAGKKTNDTITLTIVRNGQESQLKTNLILVAANAAPAGARGRGAAAGGAGGGGTTYAGLGQIWNKPILRMAIVGIEFPDTKHNPTITAKDWNDACFSHGTYNKNSITGQQVFGSVYDFYNEQSYGQLKIEGKMIPWIMVTKNRLDYSPNNGTGNQDRVLLTEALDLIGARDGRNFLANYDGIWFIYAGGRVQTNRGGIYWPHKSTLQYQTARIPYVLIPEGGQRMTDISVLCHETGHVLGLPDLYARPETPGAVGLGVWCTMSQQAGNGRPQQFCAWSKETMGWIKPAIIDPAVKQKLVLSPIEDSLKECYKVLVRPDGSEYLLLENRRSAKGFDTSLPGAGLLVWRVVRNRPILQPSTGVDGPDSVRMFLTDIPYPSSANDSFTPFTTPSSRSALGGGTPVYISNIRRQADGKISFYIGYQFE